MDVHTETMAGASIAQDHGAAVPSLGTIGTCQGDIDQLVRKMQAQAKHRIFVSEAGPCGYWLYRYLRKQAYACGGVAPSLIPNKAGDRGKRARRDALQWARLTRSGDLTLVYVPKVEDEAMRELTRARAEALSDLKAAQLRLPVCWLRHDIRYTGQATWNAAHLRWLSEVVWPPSAQQIVFQAYVRAVTEHTERLQRLTEALQERVKAGRLPPVVEALEALRGLQGTVAVTTVAELGDLTRFDTPREPMKFLGLIPSECSSGARRRQGTMTQAGHAQARRVLVEGAWAYRSPANVSRPRQLRLAKQPQALQDIRWKAQVRLWKRYRPLLARGQHANQGGVAMAREWVGCMWAIAKAVPVAL